MIQIANAKDVEKKINNQIKQINTLIKKREKSFVVYISNAFYKRVLYRLKNGYDTEQYSNLVTIEHHEDYSKVIVKDNYENIMEFLEFGTGLLGKENPHNRAVYRSWRYAIHENEYKHHDGKKGFIFILKDGYYLAENDEQITSVKPVIFSQGIKPLRYWYDTVDEFELIFNSCKSANQIKEKIRMLGAG